MLDLLSRVLKGQGNGNKTSTVRYMSLKPCMGAAAAAGGPIEGPVKVRSMSHVIRAEESAEEAEVNETPKQAE
jgi:hypothetical protein